jgi:hypothetical protein
MPHYNLFLDDQRTPEQVTWVKLPSVEWIVAKNYQDFVSSIMVHGLPAHISFDHDLAYPEHYNTEQPIPYDSYREKTGYDCAKWLVEHCIVGKHPLPECYIHTMNPVGRVNIDGILKSYQSYAKKYE